MTPIYIALDFPDWKQTKQFLDVNQLHGIPVKVGMELFYREGPIIIEKLKRNNHPIFLDLKLHDIPTTVKKTMRNISLLGVDIVNVHALGGREMMCEAREGLLQGAHSNTNTALIAVTILTSITKDVLETNLSLTGSVTEQATRLARMAHDSGADGVVCSAHEASEIKQACGSPFITVTPGIRMISTARHDQKRVATPAYARQHQADILVIGRSITEAKEPLKAYQQAKKEWENATI